jgi:hypothetical protein
LPGATYNAPHLGDLSSARASADSLPPPPTTKTVIGELMTLSECATERIGARSARLRGQMLRAPHGWGAGVEIDAGRATAVTTTEIARP